jgi:hypothetical protein
MMSAANLQAQTTSPANQGTCSQALTDAQKAYDDGRISEINGMLSACLENGFTKEEKITAYKLITLTNLYFNEKTKAEESMLQFLRLNPEYEINTEDTKYTPIEFINLYNSFRTRPIFLFGGIAGINFHDVDVVRNFSVDNTNEKRGEYKSKFGFKVGLAMEITRWKKYSVYTELVFSRRSYSFSDNLLGYAQTSLTENQMNLELPLMLRRNFGKNKKYVPYFNIGPTFHYLFSSKGEIIRKDEIGGISREVNGPAIDLMPQRHKLNYSLSIGGGLKMKNIISNGYIVLDLRYNHGLRNIANPLTRNDNSTLTYDYMYIDPDFRMNTFQFSIAYIMPKYKPKLKKVKASEEAPVPTAQPSSTPSDPQPEPKPEEKKKEEKTDKKTK